MTMVRDKTECELAATLLNLQDKSAHVGQVNYDNQIRPYGCIYAGNDWLGWHLPDGPPYPSYDHYINDCGTYYACICKLPGKHNF